MPTSQLARFLVGMAMLHRHVSLSSSPSRASYLFISHLHGQLIQRHRRRRRITRAEAKRGGSVRLPIQTRQTRTDGTTFCARQSKLLDAFSAPLDWRIVRHKKVARRKRFVRLQIILQECMSLKGREQWTHLGLK